MSIEDKLADTIGLTGYAIDSTGIGGVLKARVADFRVDEISTKISLDPRGRFTAANITLTNWETNRFIGKLAKACGISRNRIFFAGTKDKRAITRQIFIIDAPQNKVANVEIPVSLSTWGEGAFRDSGIMQLMLSDGLETIGKYAFSGCTKLQKVRIPSSLKTW